MTEDQRHEDFKKELKELLKKYNAEICAYVPWEGSSETEIEIYIDNKEVFNKKGNSGISHYDL